MPQLLSSFITRNGFPSFNLSSIRRSAAVAHHHVSGSLHAAGVRLNHLSVSTTSHYTKDAEQIRRYHDKVIQHFQGLMVQASLEIDRTMESSSASRATTLAVPAETVFGFRCRDPFSGVAEGSQAGNLCLQFQKCATCPGALIPLDNVEVVGRLLSAFAALGNARERAIKEGWMPRFKAHYETTWRVLAEEILPAVSDDIKQRAMHLVDERHIPRLE